MESSPVAGVGAPLPGPPTGSGFLGVVVAGGCPRSRNDADFAANLMPVYQLDSRVLFPDPALSDPSGLLAVGGDLSVPRLVLAYQNGIFPWYSEGQMIRWHSPPWRFVVRPEALYVNRTTEKWIRRGVYELRYDTAFEAVMRACGTTFRPDQDGTWVTRAMIKGYVALHEHGLAHSAEAWKDGVLVGGLYGVTLGGIFFGESMFSHADNASKVAFSVLARKLFESGYALIDSQVYTDHVAGFGGEEIPRAHYLRELREALLVQPRSRWPSHDLA